MHEMSLAEGVVQLVEDAARKEGALRVTRVILEIGRLSSVEPEAMKFCFAAVTRGSIADGALLEIIDVPGSGCCLACGAVSPLAATGDPCPACASYRIEASGGTGMRVKEIEIE